MFKTILHIVVALGLWFGLGALPVGVPWRIGAIVLGAIAVHLIWENFIADQSIYFGAYPVSFDDPVMQEAVAKARAEWDVFLHQIYPQHAQDSMVKFRFYTSSGEVESLWADLLEASGDKLKVFIRTPPLEYDEPLDPTQWVNVSDVVDWQVEYQDGTLRGGYTNLAMFKIFERQEGYLHPQIREQRSRFRDLDERAEA